MKNDFILKLYNDPSIITILEGEGDSVLKPKIGASKVSMNNVSKVIGPNGTVYDMIQIKDYVEASVDYIDKFCPYLVPFTAKLQRVFAFNIQTMATDGKRVYINPGFVAHLVDKCNGDLRGIIFVLIHEIYHNLMMHFERETRQPDIFTPKDETLINVAEDLEINWIITQSIEDPRGDDDYDHDDPDDCPYEIENGKITNRRRLIFKDIIDKIGAGLLDEKYGGWTFEKIYPELIKNGFQSPMSSAPVKHVEITSTDGSPKSTDPNGPQDSNPDEITYNIDSDERKGYEDGWAQAIADMKAQGILESIQISNKCFNSIFEAAIFEAAVKGDPSYDKGYSNGYNQCIEAVKNAINNASSSKAPIVHGTPPKCEQPKIKNPQEQGQGQGQSQGQGQDMSSIETMLGELNKLQQNNNRPESDTSNNTDTTLKVDGGYSGDNDFDLGGKHIISEEEGNEIMQESGISMNDILKSGNDNSSIFDDERKVMDALNTIGVILSNARKQRSTSPGSSTPNDIIGIVKSIRHTTIDWREELSDYFDGRVHMQEIGYNNNYIHDEIYNDLYDYDEPDAIDKVLIFLDTSGSMMSAPTDVAKCIHNIKDVIRDTNANSADIYLFSTEIYYGAPLDVEDISDNYDNMDIKLPIKSGGTAYTDIFKLVRTKYIDNDITPDAVIIMTDSDVYYCTSTFPNDFDCADNTVFLIVSNAQPERLPFGEAIYVTPDDFKKVAKKTKLNESFNYMKYNRINEAIGMPVKRKQHPSLDSSSSQPAPTLTKEDIKKMSRDAVRGNVDRWSKYIKDAQSFMRYHTYYDKLFNANHVVPNMDAINILDNGDIIVEYAITLYGDNDIRRWDRFFDDILNHELDDVYTVGDLFEFMTIKNNFTICNNSSKSLPKYMPKYVHGNMSLLRLKNLDNLDRLPKCDNINIDYCPKLSQDAINAAGIIEESKKIRTSRLTSIVESRIALARKYKNLNESFLNEDFRSTKLSSLFNTKEGSQRTHSRALTSISKTNRDILKRLEGTSDFPIMWSEITDDMITTSRPALAARSKSVLERRDQDDRYDWGIRIICDETGMIQLIMTGNNKNKKAEYPRGYNRSKYDPAYEYEWQDQGWLYVDRNLIDLINERKEYINEARLAYSIFMNAFGQLGITEDVKTPKQLLNMSYMKNCINMQQEGANDSWQIYKNIYLYVNFDSKDSNCAPSKGTIRQFIHDYYANVLNDSKSIPDIDQILDNAQPMINLFKDLNVDYTKASLSAVKTVHAYEDNSPLGYHFYDLLFPALELVPDKLAIIYDIDGKHNSRTEKSRDDSKAPLGKINSYDKDILKYGEFDINKNRKSDEIELSKFGVLNNSRKRKLIQDVRTNAITGANYSLKMLNDPRLKRMEDEGKLFTPNTYERSKSIFDEINGMIDGISNKFEKTSQIYERIYPNVKEYDSYNKVKKLYQKLSNLISDYENAGNNMIKQTKFADMIIRKASSAKSEHRLRSRGYKDTVSGELAYAFDIVKDDMRKVYDDKNKFSYALNDLNSNMKSRLINLSNFTIKDYLAKDKEDLINKLVHYSEDPDNIKTRYSMKLEKEQTNSIRTSFVNKMKQNIEIFIAGYIFLINEMSDLRAALHSLEKNK